MANRKKVALFGCLGCLGIVIIIGGLLAGGIGWISYKTVQFGKEVSASYTETANLYKDLNQKYAFTPPADGLLTDKQIQAFLESRDETAAYYNTVTEKIADKTKDADQTLKQKGFWAKIQGVNRLGDMIKFFATLGIEIGQNHCKILEKVTMSPKEYEWITKTFLGTLAKSGANQFTAGDDIWKKYLITLDEARKSFKNVNFNLGRKNVRGDDLNPNELARILEPFAFVSANQALIQPALDKFSINKEVVVIDFIAINFDDILIQLSNSNSQPFVPPVPSVPEPVQTQSPK